VVMRYAKAEHQANTTCVLACKLLTFKKVGNRINAVFYDELCVFLNVISGEKRITGGDKRAIIHIDRAAVLLNFSCEAIVKALEIVTVKVVKINIVLLNEALYHWLR